MIQESYISEVVVSHEEIVNMCEHLGQEITQDYEGKCPVLVGLLKGAIPFMAELIKHIHCDCTLDFMQCSSYQGTKSVGEVKMLKDLQHDIKGKHVIIVEDIVDTGKTLKAIIEMLKDRGAASVEIVALFNKPEGRTVELPDPKYIGMHCPNKFLVGFGLDYDELYRNLDYVGVLKPEIYQK